jgi:hypothetical protein
MEADEKEARGRKRERSLMLDKKSRGKGRNSSEEGRYKNLGNSATGFCSCCRPSLAIRIYNKQIIKKETMNIRKIKKKCSATELSLL